MMAGEIEVDVAPLDEVLLHEQLREVKLVKIDVEGAEVVLELSRKIKSCLKLLQTLSFKVHKLKFTRYYICSKL